MRVSQLVKQLFAVMSKNGDIEVSGSFDVVNKQLILRSPEVGLEQEDSEILPKLLTAQRDESTSVYL